MKSVAVAIASGVLLAVLLYGSIELFTSPQTPVVTDEETRTMTVFKAVTKTEQEAEADKGEKQREGEQPLAENGEITIQANGYYTPALVLTFSILLASTIYLMTRRKVYG